MDKEPITLNGLRKLEDELIFLKEKKRPEIVAAIAEARSHGDLKENAEYHAAKELQGLTEAKITEIENALANAQVIDVRDIPETGRVVFGSTVVVYDTGKDSEITYKIVGNLESKPEEGLISVETPIARGLIGKFVEDEVRISTPSGEIEYEILSVKHL